MVSKNSCVLARVTGHRLAKCAYRPGWRIRRLTDCSHMENTCLFVLSFQDAFCFCELGLLSEGACDRGCAESQEGMCLSLCQNRVMILTTLPSQHISDTAWAQVRRPQASAGFCRGSQLGSSNQALVGLKIQSAPQVKSS